MQTLQIDGKKAKELYPTASAEIKAIFEETFGAAYFSSKITDRVKTFEDACAELKYLPTEIKVTNVLIADEKAIIAFSKLSIIARALNQGWKPNWTDSSEYKYVPWFKHQSGLGLSYGDYAYWDANTIVGSHLCYKTKELAEYAAKQFVELYHDFLTIQ